MHDESQLTSTFDINHLTTATTGEPRSLDFRVQFHYNDHGQLKQISPWHDIPLFSPDGYVHMLTEIPKFSRAKFEIATGEPFNPIKQDTKNGKLRDYKYGDMCFNYGAFPQTWEDPNHVRAASPLSFATFAPCDWLARAPPARRVGRPPRTPATWATTTRLTPWRSATRCCAQAQ